MENQENLPGFGNLLERTFRLYKDRFWVLAGIMLLPVLLIALVIIIVLLLILAGALSGVSLSDNLLLLLFLALFALIFLVVFAIISIWSQAALLSAIKGSEEKIGIKESFKRGWYKIIPYWLVSILMSFMVLGGFFLFFVPGIILSIWFSLALYVLIAEDKKGFGALFRSRQLIKGFWWKVFWRQILLSLMAYGAVTAASAIPFAGNLASFFIAPFIHIFWFLLYQDLKTYKKDPVFEEPKTAVKMKYILMAVGGFVLAAGIIIFSLFLYKQYVEERNTSEAKQLMEESLSKIQKAKEINVALESEAATLQLVSEAIDDAKKAADLSPNNPEILFQVGNVYSQVRNFAAGADNWAVIYYKKALELDSDNSLYQEKIKELEKNISF